MSKVRYPGIEVFLIGQDGNAFTILGAVRAALRANGISAEDISLFSAQATSGDYSNLLDTVQDWVVIA